MKRQQLSTVFAFAVALCVLPANLHAEKTDDILVIVHADNPTKALGRSDLRPIFQTNKTDWDDGGKILPLNLSEADATRRGFDAAILGLDPDRVARYWIDRKIRGGARPPKKVPSAALVVAVVGKKKGAIGYVPTGTAVKGVKVVARIVSGSVEAP